MRTGCDDEKRNISRGHNVTMATEKLHDLSLTTFGSVASLLVVTLYQGNHDRNHKLCHIVSAERYTLYAGAVGMLLHINGKFVMKER